VRRLGCLAAALLGFWASHAFASPALVIEMPSGAILYEDHATQPWYPASLTKLMTVYVALSAVRDHSIALDTPLSVSARAAMMPPSKMGFRPGSLVTLDNALKMLMVKSANDMAVVIAEGVSGSVEAFAEDMNSTARELGLAQSHFVNPNGLPNPEHVSSARDLAILARALYLTFPEQANLFNIGALRLGDQIIQNHNNLLGRYPGADGMKTGFTCAAGFNLVASASQGGRKLIAVILGAPNLRSSTIMAAALFDRGLPG
jgi:D-alanyl-D-alanine carboxypeptidase